jgi:hypothetical protein
MFRSVSSPPCLQWLWYSPDILSSENQKLFFFQRIKACIGWSCLFTFTWCWGLEYIELHHHIHASVVWCMSFISMEWDYVSELWLPAGPLFILLIIYEYGAMVLLTRKNQRTGEKSVPMPFCPPQIPHGLTWASSVRGWLMTTWAVAWPCSVVLRHGTSLALSLPNFTCSWGKCTNGVTYF